MKKLFLTLALLALMVHGAEAASCDGNTDVFNVGNWCITSNDTLIPTTSAGQQIIYELYNTENTINNLSADESGKHIVDNGGTTDPTDATVHCSKHVLPRAAVGLTYTLTTGSRCSVTLDTLDTGDKIHYTISGTALSAGDSVLSTGQAGDSITVFSPVANQWHIGQMKGSWTDNNTN